MIYYFQIGLLAVNIAMAAYHAKLIKQERKVQHGLWGGGYFLFAGILCLLAHSWWLGFLALLIRKVVFDLSLNLFRGLPLFYVSSKTTSVFDKFFYKVFGKKSEIYIGVFMLVIVVLNILIFNKIF